MRLVSARLKWTFCGTDSVDLTYRSCDGVEALPDQAPARRLARLGWTSADRTVTDSQAMSTIRFKYWSTVTCASGPITVVDSRSSITAGPSSSSPAFSE